MHSGENFPQRAFARAVLPDEGVAGPALHGETHPVERKHAGEAFGDPAEFKKRHGAREIRKRREIQEALAPLPRELAIRSYSTLGKWPKFTNRPSWWPVAWR